MPASSSAHHHGIVTSTTLLATAAIDAEQLAALRDSGLGVGVHVNLTLGRPLSNGRSLVDADGRFVRDASHAAARAGARDVEREVNAQVEKFAYLMRPRADASRYASSRRSAGARHRRRARGRAAPGCGRPQPERDGARPSADGRLRTPTISSASPVPARTGRSRVPSRISAPCRPACPSSWRIPAGVTTRSPTAATAASARPR